MLFDKVSKKGHRGRAKADRNIQPTASKGVQLKRIKSHSGGADLTGWDPKDVTGLQLWLRADNAVDTFVADGDVTAWSDESGEGHNCTVPSTAGFRPHWTENVFGTKPGILFTGSSNQHLDTTGISGLFADDVSDSDYTVIIMFKPTVVATDNQAIFSQYNSTNWAATASNSLNRLAMGIDADSKSTILGNSTTGDVAIGDTLVNDTSYIMVARHEYATTTMRNFLNGTLNLYKIV